ncbi:Glutamate racemase [Paraburkholderia hiiakae]|uniref:Glutamate racemase n=1 Tax=Paraburkholderia hiiakae TaxID=1081782 RepID=A0ABM8NMX8_9BURK|nr:aspartate/glutamate racemase family protein [Paraburkholderia hiiakae]CAD6533888.1 Glutamate racemase [Paraburkholderia hiiakae]
MQFNLHKPIGVFDAGIGSYAIVEVIRRCFPQQDILYLADRASFPYGAKSHSELADCVSAAIETLARFGAAAVVLASNAPSVMVLDEVEKTQSVPVLGIYPPVAQALGVSRSGVVAVLGVQSLVQSHEIQAYIARESGGRRVEVVNGSPLVQRVEDGTFLSDPSGTQREVNDFIDRLRSELPGLDTCTLSSTHLPWLLPFFERAAPDMVFLDPANALVPRLSPHTTSGSGTTVCIATQSEQFPLAGLRDMFELLGVEIVPHLVEQ